MQPSLRKLSCFLATTILAAVLTAATAEEPMRLTERQLDTVTAGDIAVVATAAAEATGTSTATYTGTNASVWSMLGGIQVGTSQGSAYAVGTATRNAEVYTNGYSSSSATMAASQSIDINTSNSAFGRSSAYIVSQ